MGRPDLLIEHWLPSRELGIESIRERAAPSALPPLYFLHVWWARRPLVASAGAVLASLMPTWTAELADEYSDYPELATEKDYHAWFLRLVGILGDPVSAAAKTRAAREAGVRIPNPYTYKQAYKNSPTVHDLDRLSTVLRGVWGKLPEVLDPTAGGGSIPFEAIRYGLPYSSRTTSTLLPLRCSPSWRGTSSCSARGRHSSRYRDSGVTSSTRRIEKRTRRFFPDGPDGKVATFLFARTVACPHTGKPVPLAPNWWLSRGKTGTASVVHLVTERQRATLLTNPSSTSLRRQRDRQTGNGFGHDHPGRGEYHRGDNLTIDGDYVKAEAQAGRMGSILYAVVVRTGKGRDLSNTHFNRPDAAAFEAAEAELARLLPVGGRTGDVIPDEKRFPDGNDMRPDQPTMGCLGWRGTCSHLASYSFMGRSWKSTVGY